MVYKILPYKRRNDNEQYEIIRYHVYEFLRDICFESNPKERIVLPSMIEKYMRLKHIIEHLRDTNGSKLLAELYRDFCSPFNKTNDEQITKAITNNEWFKKTLCLTKCSKILNFHFNQISKALSNPHQR